jgi:hypothetical protein
MNKGDVEGIKIFEVDFYNFYKKSGYTLDEFIRLIGWKAAWNNRFARRDNEEASDNG